ncbi:MAG: hypothetical protein LBU65_02770 [Planctomycetaceae bacterium]|jgi:alpha-mannosidase|nr:hypothetical protein [Planctomycetaceae bacterium]
MHILYPGYTFETLSMNRSDGEASELVVAYSALFHPAIVEQTKHLPNWESAAAPMSPTAPKVLVIPPCCEKYIDDTWTSKLDKTETIVVRNLSRRDEIITFIIEKLNVTDHNFDNEFVNDCLALGTFAFVTDLLTRQIRYMSVLDNSRLQTELLDTINAYREHDTAKIDEAIAKAFDVVTESKEYFYTSQSYLLNFLLLPASLPAEHLSPQVLQPQLHKSRKTTLWLPTATLERLAADFPESLQLIRSAVENGDVQIVGDERRGDNDIRMPLLSQDEIASKLRNAIARYTDLLGKRPLVFGRLTAGLTPVLPQLLALTSYTGAIHFTPLDGWKPNDTNQSKIEWKGIDGTCIDALIRYPLNAAEEDNGVEVASKLGQILDTDHVVTIAFAHFPNQPTQWMDDFLTANKFTKSLGEFVLIDDYFAQTKNSGNKTSYSLTDYRINELQSAVEQGHENPISRWVAYNKTRINRQATTVLEIMTRLLNPNETSHNQSLEQAAVTFTKTLAASNEQSDEGLLFINPLTVPRTVYYDITCFTNELDCDTIVADITQNGKREAAIKVPPLGYSWLGQVKSEQHTQEHQSREIEKKHPAKPKSFLQNIINTFTNTNVSKAKERPLVAEISIPTNDGNRDRFYLLRNNFYEAKIDTATGALFSVRFPEKRGNRLAQQIAYRLSKAERATDTRPIDDPNFGYTIMAADKFEIETSNLLTGCLKINGRLVHPDGHVAATFIERFTVRRTSPVIEIAIELEPEFQRENTIESAWESYYAIRWGWGNEMLDTFGSINGNYQKIDSDTKQIHSTEFIDLRTTSESLTILTDGLPFHRRVGLRRIDTLLSVHNEKSKIFRCAFGLELPNPQDTSKEFQLEDKNILVKKSQKPRTNSAWLGFIEAKNIEAIDWQILTNESGLSIQVQLQETKGKPSQFQIIFCRPIKQAIKQNQLNEPQEQLETNNNKVKIKMRPHEVLPIRIDF